MSRYTLSPYPSDRPSRLHVWNGSAWVLGPDPELQKKNGEARERRQFVALAEVDPLTALLAREGIT